ncbi:MAG: putative aldehyde dehydrogenase, partial [Frankiales bacterium]|nr:putative aldehyde dehydrogenase [Frankiales bacterium]
DEVFGPVLAVIPSDSEEHAIQLANDSPFGLNGSVFTNDIDRAFYVAGEVRSGTFGHNSTRMNLGIAFGGFKQSGIGREGGIEGLRPYLDTKTLLMDGLPSS